MEHITVYLREFYSNIYIPDLRIIDCIEILIIAVFFYRLMLWVRDTKAWMLLRGILVIGMFLVIAILLNMQTILYIAQNAVNVLAMIAVVVFQPEIRRALENLGQKNLLTNFGFFDKKNEGEYFTENSIDAIMKACEVMKKDKTGALIVIENQIKLNEFVETGIEMDCKLSSQILVNIFEHNTPLHDGAIIIRENRILAATCYLPLSENMSLDKNLGTRHRAAIGISEISDAMVIVVSEETGNVSVADEGHIYTKLTEHELEKKLAKLDKTEIQERQKPVKTSVNKWLGGRKNEKIDPS